MPTAYEALRSNISGWDIKFYYLLVFLCVNIITLQKHHTYFLMQKQKEVTMNKNHEIILFNSVDGAITLPVPIKSETVWLTQAQMAKLFNKDRTVIGRHIRNAITDGEINPNIMCTKFAHMGKDGDQIYNVDIYNLDVIITVGYRVKSQRGVEFRRYPQSCT